MATQIYLGMPPENIKQFIIENYGKQEEPVDMTKVPLTFTAEEAGAKLSLVSKNGPAVTLETSPSGEEGSWTPYTVGNEIILENVGDKVMFRNSSDEIQVMSISDFEYNQFTIRSGKIAASGNIMFLMDKTGELKDLNGEGYCYYNMFLGCTSLTQAPILPATTLAYYCYGSMFFNCSALTQAPELPATNLDEACYSDMFYNCKSLTQAPELPATTLASSCYYSMFGGCSALTQAPELPATTFSYSCYAYMFDGCTNIPEPKYDMSHLTFDEVANAVQNNYIFGEEGRTYEIQCSDKILVATYDEDNYEWTITEK